ncbi:MAG: hypothetical protein M3388_00230 [Acidobacteriota bacterium]|nr:hypothetical protein [Acidobacteriota bacterium]
MVGAFQSKRFDAVPVRREITGRAGFSVGELKGNRLPAVWVENFINRINGTSPLIPWTISPFALTSARRNTATNLGLRNRLSIVAQRTTDKFS